MTDSPTERAIAAFDQFLTQWMPPAVQPLMFDHSPNAAELVRQTIRGIIDQRRLPLTAAPLGHLVLSQHYSRGHSDGFRYEVETAVFDTTDQAFNAHKFLVEKRAAKTPGYVIGEIRKMP